jgi:hypothetical protein
VAFEVKGRLQDLYPKIFPKHQEDARVVRGLKLFQQTCLACHTLNREGPSQVGPDLNLPLNPTEYFKESILPQYIRNPKSVRSWEGSKMPGFSRPGLPKRTSFMGGLPLLTDLGAQGYGPSGCLCGRASQEVEGVLGFVARNAARRRRA